MKKLSQIIFTLAMVVGMAFSVSAQKDDQKKPPKNPPVVDPGKKGPRNNPPPPRDDKKKPGSEFYLASLGRENDLA